MQQCHAKIQARQKNAWSLDSWAAQFRDRLVADETFRALDQNIISHADGKLPDALRSSHQFFSRPNFHRGSLRILIWIAPGISRSLTSTR